MTYQEGALLMLTVIIFTAWLMIPRNSDED